MRKYFALPFILICLICLDLCAQRVDLSEFDQSGAATVHQSKGTLKVSWPVSESEKAEISLNLTESKPLIQSINIGEKEVLKGVDPLFLLTVGQRDLSKESGWNIFFDRTAYKPYKEYRVSLEKKRAKVISNGARTLVQVGSMEAGGFEGRLEITLYHGSQLMNMAAVLSTEENEKAIIYDAGLVSDEVPWKEIFWSDTDGYLQSRSTEDIQAENLKVKYRSIIGETDGGSVAVFPSPHQYFYPLDNVYNLKNVWAGRGYRELVAGYGLGIRHDLMGDRRHVPWFNAPPNTEQRLNFFLYITSTKDGQVMEEVKKFTHSDQYKPLPGYRTMASHFHTEHMDDILTHKPVPDVPGHVNVLRSMGVNIMHLGEYHLAGNPRDSGPRRLPELQLMFEECERLSVGNFLMLPGEEPNVHFGGHWMNIFPKPVYWIMSREGDQPFVEQTEEYGPVYRVGNKAEMLQLLEEENGLAWTAHARTKGSTGYPDRYNTEDFFHSDRFNGAAWKALPADLSRPNLGQRVLGLMDDMANWGEKKYVIGEADLFKIEPDYEAYAHMNVNYLEMDKLPKFEEGWQPVLDAMQTGKFFVTTGEVLLQNFSVDGKGSGEMLSGVLGKVNVKVDVDWTFPLNYVLVVSGDGNEVFREKVDLSHTKSFEKESFTFQVDLSGKKWVRLEVWDVAANGAFTQPVWLE